MKGYIFTIIAVSIISGIITSMLSSKNSLKKYVNFVAGLICTLTLLSPVVKIANDVGTFSSSVESVIGSLSVEENVSSTNKIIIDTGSEQVCEGVKNVIISKYGFKQNDIDVYIKLNDENIQAIILEEIEISLKNEASWTDEHKLKKYVEDIVGCKVKITKH